MAELTVLEQKISYFKIDDEDYISIADMLKSKDGDFFVSDWLRNRNTIEFLGIWEEIHNPNFNYGEFAIIKNQAGVNSDKISVKEWVEKTNAIGIMSKAGRYGGTYAHKDIVFEFGMWISPKFKLLLIKEFERLKKEWRCKNPNLDGNIRDYATINELICLANLENLNSVFINDGLKQPERLEKLNKIAISQIQILNNNDIKYLK